jgi:hypothetical protein
VIWIENNGYNNYLGSKLSRRIKYEAPESADSTRYNLTSILFKIIYLRFKIDVALRRLRNSRENQLGILRNRSRRSELINRRYWTAIIGFWTLKLPRLQKNFFVEPSFLISEQHERKEKSHIMLTAGKTIVKRAKYSSPQRVRLERGSVELNSDSSHTDISDLTSDF